MKKFISKIALVTLVISGLFSCSSDESSTSSSNNTFSELIPSGSVFSERWRHQSVSFNGKIWVIGGQGTGTPTTGFNNEIWNSTNGVTWAQTTPNGAVFSARMDHRVIVFNNKIWLIGGYDDSGRKDDIWNSADGITWAQVTPTGSCFGPTSIHTLTVFNNKMWLIGGLEGTNFSNAIWNTSDGINWTQVSVSGSLFSARYSHQTFALNNKIFVVGGYNNTDGILHDVWSSSDGTTWVEEDDTNAFSDRYYHNCIVKDSKVYLICGNLSNEMWTSTDGISWTEITKSNNYISQRRGQSSVLHNGDIYVIAGEATGNANYLNDVWKYKF